MAQQNTNNQNIVNLLNELADAEQVKNVEYSGHRTRQQMQALYEELKPTEKSKWNTKCDSFVKSGQIDQATANFLKSVPDQEPLVGFLLKALIPILLFMRNLGTTLDVAQVDLMKKAMAKSQPNNAPVEYLIQSMIIDPGRSSENRQSMKELGYNNTQIDNMILSHYRLYDENMIRTCYLRGIIDKERMYERMRELGYTDTRTSEIIQTWELLPSPQDLFLMVAHEAFEPDMYTKLGLDQEFPTEQVKWLKEQGISENWAEKYWIAHWAQPSIGQGFEMLHRGVIDLDTLDLLFRAVEIPNFWRDKLTQIAYTPLARVDVRRMHDLGVIDDEKLIKSYLDLGYSPENAVNMANFTIKYNAESRASLTRSTILTSYSEGLLSRTDTINLLKEQDYTDEVAEYYVSLEDFNKAKEVQDLTIKNLEEKYKLGINDQTYTRDSLTKMGLLADKIDALLESWDIELYKYQRLPSKSDLDNFLVYGIIDENEYYEIMQQHGFSWRHISFYLQQLEGDRYFAGRSPTKSDLDKWVKNKTITKEEYQTTLKAAGYSERYINYYLKQL